MSRLKINQEAFHPNFIFAHDLARKFIQPPSEIDDVLLRQRLACLTPRLVPER
jgi:hypothetical protein